MRSKGKIASWNDERGYGFIAPFDDGPQVFIHIKALANRNRRPQVNDVVSYAIARDKQGRVRAADATLAGDKLPERKKRRRDPPSIVVALVFLAAVCFSVFATGLPLLIAIVYLVASVATFVAYVADKSAAQKGGQRISEDKLHLLALSGGWPGALIAQQTERHKTQKTSFRVIFCLTVLLNCAALVWLHTQAGRTWLEQLLAG
ncbi:MAG: DUF1294 domain-containing protein [Gammaproteobacteria bacterium]